MHSQAIRNEALALIDRGHNLSTISYLTGVSRATLRDWRDHPPRYGPRGNTCERCADVPRTPEPRQQYAYLLGLYLGDGCISRAGAKDKDVWKLRIMCADAWPGLLEECKQAMTSIRQQSKVMTTHRQGCSEVFSTSKHWPCLFPQHGPGRKHERRIELEQWQEQIVSQETGNFVRGLFHSDGWRGVNRVRGRLADGDRWYEYPRYLFINESANIRQLCSAALDRLGVAWRYSKTNTISVARRAVARLDQFVGPKY
jgi:hypothetical protein